MKKPLIFQLVGLAALAVILVVGCSEDSMQKPQASMESPESGSALLGGRDDLGDAVLAEDKSVSDVFITVQGPIESIPYDRLQPEGFIALGDVQAGPEAGTHYEGVLAFDCVGVAERFVGQDLSTVFVGNYAHDALSSNADGPLALMPGATGQNVGVASNTSCGSTEVLFGWGPLGYPEDWGGGEGSVAILFDDDQSELGLKICGGEGGGATIHFFARDGSLLATASSNYILGGLYGFRTHDGVAAIAGLSICNTDRGGLAYLGIVFDVSICNVTCVEGVGVRVTPETFNVARAGQWVTAHATLPAGYVAADLAGATIVSIGSLATAIPGTPFGQGGTIKFSSEEFSNYAAQLVAPGDPRMEDVPVCIELTFSDGMTSCENCWMIDIIYEGKGGPDSESRGATSVSGDFDPNSQ